MKNFLFGLLLFGSILSGSAFAGPEPKIDCSKAVAGKVTIRVKGVRLDLIGAAKKAYACFERTNAALLARLDEAVSKANLDADDSGSREGQCHPHAVVGLKIASWNSERVDVYGDTGGSATVLIQRSIACGPMGTGMFSGITANVFSTIEIDEAVHIDEATDAITQKLTLKLKPASVN